MQKELEQKEIIKEELKKLSLIKEKLKNEFDREVNEINELIKKKRKN